VIDDTWSPDEGPEHRGPFLGRLRSLQNDMRVRFVLVGLFNTGFGYLLFIILELAFHLYFLSLYGSFAVASVEAFFLHRHYTYRVAGTGRIWVDFARFLGVYVVALAINSVALPVLVEIAGLPSILAQGLIVLATTMISYFGHKLFSFRRPPPGTEPASSDS
jgi:putative flippase GtrA